MRRTCLPVIAGLVLLATAALGTATARAATLTVDHPCYSSGQRIEFRGAGFAPGAPIAVRFAGRTLTGPVSADGTIAGFFTTPSPSRNQQRFTLSAGDGAHNVTANVTATRVLGDFNPSNGSPQTLRVRILVQGLGALLDRLRRNPHGTVYAHYIRPSGTLRANRRLGSLGGTCGSLLTRRVRLLPYGDELGSWRVYLDTNRTYRRREVARVFFGFTVRLAPSHR